MEYSNAAANEVKRLMHLIRGLNRQMFETDSQRRRHDIEAHIKRLVRRRKEQMSRL